MGSVDEVVDGALIRRRVWYGNVRQDHLYHVLYHVDEGPMVRTYGLFERVTGILI